MQKQLKVCVLNNNIVSQIYVFTGTDKDVGKNMTDLGTIQKILRYAVKSMGGELLNEAKIIEGGILGMKKTYSIQV